MGERISLRTWLIHGLILATVALFSAPGAAAQTDRKTTESSDKHLFDIRNIESWIVYRANCKTRWHGHLARENSDL